MNQPPDFDATLRSWLQRAAPQEAPDRLLAAALFQAANEPQRRGWLASLRSGSRKVLRGAALSAVVVLAILAGIRMANLGLDVGGSPSLAPSASSVAEASALPSEAASIVCEAFADGGAMDHIAFGFISSRNPEGWPTVLSAGATELLALADRAPAEEREDLMAIAIAVERLTTAYAEATRYSSDDFWDLPEDVRNALQNAAQDALDGLQAAEPAFYLKYGEPCGLDLNSPTVDCGGLDQVTCDRVVADLIESHRQAWKDGLPDVGLPPGLPVTDVVLGGASPSGCIPHQEIYWPGGGVVADSLC